MRKKFKAILAGALLVTTSLASVVSVQASKAIFLYFSRC